MLSRRQSGRCTRPPGRERREEDAGSRIGKARKDGARTRATPPRPHVLGTPAELYRLSPHYPFYLPPSHAPSASRVSSASSSTRCHWDSDSYTRAAHLRSLAAGAAREGPPPFMVHRVTGTTCLPSHSSAPSPLGSFVLDPPLFLPHEFAAMASPWTWSVRFLFLLLFERTGVRGVSAVFAILRFLFVPSQGCSSECAMESGGARARCGTRRRAAAGAAGRRRGTPRGSATRARSPGCRRSTPRPATRCTRRAGTPTRAPR